jgi:hypothetical protein
MEPSSFCQVHETLQTLKRELKQMKKTAKKFNSTKFNFKKSSLAGHLLPQIKSLKQRLKQTL